MQSTPKPSLFKIAAPLATLAVIGAIAFTALSAKVPPAPVQAAEPVPPAKGMAVATLSGGCFWSMEALYSRLKGVKSAEPGYSGGTVANPTYEQVCTETTGHAESVNITYDPKVISYGELVTVLLTVLDPTTLNQQGADVGSSYRSIIFYRTPAEKKVAQDIIKKITDKGIWPNPIVTEVTPLKKFYPAEAYHHKYYDTHPNEGYCQAVIVPKLDKLREKFPSKLKADA